MRQIVCDKCGQTRESQDCTIWIGRSSQGLSLRDIDLCYSCAFDLYKWLKGEPIPKQTTT